VTGISRAAPPSGLPPDVPAADGPGGGCALDYDNDPALELAHRLVGLRSGQAWRQIQARDTPAAGSQTPLQLAAVFPVRRVDTRPVTAQVAGVCGAAIAGAELSSSFFGAIPAAVFDAVLASVLLLLFVRRPWAKSSRLLPVLALVSLIRPISLAAVVPTLGPLLYYAFAGLPLLAGAVLAVRLVEEPVRELHLRLDRPRRDAAVALAGLPAGLLGYLLLGPAPLLAHPSAVGYFSLAVILVVFGGLLEELVFRGLVQSAAIHSFDDPLLGVCFAAALSTALYWGSGSIPYMLLMGSMSCALGVAVLRGASLWGVALSHGSMLVAMALLAQGLAR
jgi:membrane protease YdiL (CAAX protease family)